jgi:hypothetical protein
MYQTIPANHPPMHQMYQQSQIVTRAQDSRSDSFSHPNDDGSMLSAAGFLAVLVGANVLAIWCELHNPNR